MNYGLRAAQALHVSGSVNIISRYAASFSGRVTAAVSSLFVSDKLKDSGPSPEIIFRSLDKNNKAAPIR